jgi:uncharacterized protein YcfL
MKKVFFVAIAIFALASCTKDRNCHCTGKSFIEDTDVDYVNVIKDTKKAAETQCKKQSYENVRAKVDCVLQ